MANYVIIGTVAAVVGLLTYGIPILLDEYFPWQRLSKQRTGKPTVTTKSYAGRTALITGASGALGSLAAKMFARRDIDTLVLVDVMDLSAVRDEILGECKTQGKPAPNILIWRIDMMTFKGCQELGQKARSLKNLDHALLAAGLFSYDRKDSPDGWETSEFHPSAPSIRITNPTPAIQVNYLSTALISLLLLPHLKSSPSNHNPPVLTFVTSFGIYLASPTMVIPKTGSYLKHLSNNKPGLQQGSQYGRSKALLLYFARELAAYATNLKSKVTINSADPGCAWTPLTAANGERMIPKLITDLTAREPEFCAAALVNGVSVGPEGHGEVMGDFGTLE